MFPFFNGNLNGTPRGDLHIGINHISMNYFTVRQYLISFNIYMKDNLLLLNPQLNTSGWILLPPRGCITHNIRLNFTCLLSEG